MKETGDLPPGGKGLSQDQDAKEHSADQEEAADLATENRVRTEDHTEDQAPEIIIQDQYTIPTHLRNSIFLTLTLKERRILILYS